MLSNEAINAEAAQKVVEKDRNRIKRFEVSQ